MNASRTAAALRAIRNAAGMLMHPDAEKVWRQGGESYEAARRISIDMASDIGLTREEVRQYGRDMAERMEVVQCEDGKWRFALKEGESYV